MRHEHRDENPYSDDDHQRQQYAFHERRRCRSGRRLEGFDIDGLTNIVIFIAHERDRIVVLRVDAHKQRYPRWVADAHSTVVVKYRNAATFEPHGHPITFLIRLEIS